MTRNFSMVVGVIFLLVGILGFVPGLTTHPVNAPPLAVDSSYGHLLGLFPVNVLHNIVHLAIGLWGILAWRSAPAARIFARSLAIIYGVLAILGLFPATRTLFGLVPLYSHDIWLHAGTALIAAYFGFVVGREIRITAHAAK